MPPARRVSGSMVMPLPGDRAQVDARVAGGRGVDELVERDAVRPGQREQQLQGRPAGAGLQPGQRADRDAGRRRQVGQRGLALLAQRPQPRADRGEGLVEVVVHARQFAISATMFADRAGRPACSSSGGGHDDRSAGGQLRRGGDRRRCRRAERGADAGPVAAVGGRDRRRRAAQRAGRGRARAARPRRASRRPSCWSAAGPRSAGTAATWSTGEVDAARRATATASP